MRIRRSRTLIAALCAVLLSATACGGSEPSNGAAPAGDKKIVLWHMEQPPNRVSAYQALIDQYNATNPEYKVEQQVQDWNQIYTKIAGAAQGGAGPDILFGIPDFTTYVRQLGIVQPVTDFVKEMDTTHKFLEASKAQYFDQDQYWAVPMYGMVQMLWYRKDMFAKAGIENAPATWVELSAAAEKLTAGDTKGIALPAGKNLATDQVIYSLMLTNGAGNFFDKDGKVAFNNPKSVETFKYYNDLLKFSPPDSGNFSWGEPQAAFNSGAAAMAIEKGQYLTPFEKESGRPAADLGCAPIPVPEGGSPGSIYYSNAAMVLSKDAAKAKGAQAFLKWLLEPAQYGAFLNAEPGLFLPETADGATATSWTSNPVITQYKECVDKMLEQSKTGALFGFYDGTYNIKIGNVSGQNILAQVIQKMYANKEAPEAAVAWGATEMTAAVSK